MMIDTAFLITAFVTMFVVIDPMGMAPLFVALTQGMSRQRRRAIAVRSCVTGFMAIPLIAGPGAIASVILLTGQKPGLAGLGIVAGITLAVLLVVFVLFLASGLLERALGKTGINVVTRLLGMLLAALSVQFVLDGLRAFSFYEGLG